MATTEIIAALDLGSNSFHLKVARVADGQLAVIDRMRDPVRLAAGLDKHEQLTDEVCRRALDTLERFGQRGQRSRGGHEYPAPGA
jgi:exopolyphosphatase/guanosine-5'-triphosphate,3'-diphosphate pyrophosphatase